MNRSEASSSGALKTTIHLGKTLVATQGASTFYCMNRELPGVVTHYFKRDYIILFI